MPNEEFFFATGIRRAPMDTSQFTVQPNGTLTLWSGTGTEVVIPFMVNGVRVTAIGDGVFQRRGLTSVTIPDTVTSIGQNAFRENQLTSVTIPNSVAAIGANAFSGASNRRGSLRSVSIPDSVITIGNEAFATNELASITIPNSVTSIGNGAFASNRLTNVIIPDSVTSIGQRAFISNQLTSATIGSNVRTIGHQAFLDNRNLARVTIGADVDTNRQSFDWEVISNFVDFYTQNGRRAGTYTRSGNTWNFTPR